MAGARLLLFLLLVGENGLEHIAGLGDVREVDFGLLALGSARSGAALAAAPGVALKLRANLVRFVVFERTGVGLAAGQAELRQ
jgi:ATP-dependent protease HslVU (ClpYQ) peptidase subunit